MEYFNFLRPCKINHSKSKYGFHERYIFLCEAAKRIGGAQPRKLIDSEEGTDGVDDESEEGGGGGQTRLTDSLGPKKGGKDKGHESDYDM